ncbi:MAG: glycosyltransferase [Chloroflexota bacterium]|nr:glycosyltransferase [Chloroflexota bacterium]
MRLLLLTSSLPYPPQSGGALRAFGILRSLFDAGHHVTLLSFDDSSGDLASTPLADLCEMIITVPPPAHRSKLARIRQLLTSDQPDIVGRMANAAMQAKLSELCCQQFDAIQFEGIEMATYLAHAASTGTRAALIYDAFNAEYALQRQIADIEKAAPGRLYAAVYSELQARRIYKLEQQLCQRASAVIAVSQEDADLLRPLRGSRPLHIVPSGIFTADYVAADQMDLGNQALIFTGKMDYRPNMDAALWFADAILPQIRAAAPAARFVIVGQQPGAALDTLTTQPDIVLTGRVPQVQPYLHSAAVYVAPLRMGSGTRLKLLEAMASGCAIVATSVAAAGLDEATQNSMFIADEPSAFAEAILSLLGDPDRRQHMGAQAQQVVRSRYDWAALAPRLLRVYEELGIG